MKKSVITSKDVIIKLKSLGFKETNTIKKQVLQLINLGYNYEQILYFIHYCFEIKKENISDKFGIGLIKNMTEEAIKHYKAEEKRLAQTQISANKLNKIINSDKNIVYYTSAPRKFKPPTIKKGDR